MKKFSLVDSSWKLVETNWNMEYVDVKEVKYCKIPLLNKAGISSHVSDATGSHQPGNRKKIESKTLYMRKEALRAYEQLDDKRASGVVVQGSPGIGKSCIVWRRALDQAHKGSSILWVHVNKRLPERCLKFFDKKIYEKTDISMDEANKIVLKERVDIVVVDGAYEGENNELCQSAFNYYERRGIIVCSMALDRNLSHDLLKELAQPPIHQ